MWNYSKKMLDYFYSPKNFGELKDADVAAEVGSLACGDALKLYLKVDEKSGAITDASFETFGCGSAIASSSALTEMIKGKSLDEALKITNEDIARYLDGLPPEKMHCSVMGKEALEKAVAIYRGENPSVEKEEGTIVCHCFGVTSEKIKRVAMENNLKTVEGVTNYTKAGGGCGCCIPQIEDILAELWSGSPRQEKAVESDKKADTKPKMTIIRKIQLINSVLENEIRPSLQADGGDIELIDFNGTTVSVALRGTCSGCTSSSLTIKGFIEKKLREIVDENIIVEEAG